MKSRILLCLAALLPVWLLGFIHLPHPFDGDQALFMVGARQLEQGARLYVDFWDNKQPGIYLFYWLAGRLFGFHEVGVHTLELLWYSVLSVGMVLGLQRHFQRPWLAVFVPLASIGLFYGMCDKWHLAQVEIMVSLPLFGCLWLSSHLQVTAGRHFLHWFLSGVCAGVLVTFKLALAPLAIAIWTMAILVRLYIERWGGMRMVLWGLLAAFLGGMSVLCVVAVGFMLHGSYHEMVWTTFIYPMEALAKSEAASLSRLMGSIAWLGANACSVILFAILGLVSWRGLRREVLTAVLLGCMAAACAVIYIQSWSWWQYHFCLFLVPLGILGIRGLDALLPMEPWRGRRWSDFFAATVLALSLLGPAVPGLGMKVLAFAQEVQHRTPWLHDYQRAIDKDELRMWEMTQFLRDEPSKAPIYVFGNPVYLYLSGRNQALPEHGWSWETFLPSQWKSLPEKLRTIRPAWLFTDPNYADLINQRSPATREVIQTLYEPRLVTDDGTWFSLRAPPR